MLLGWLLSMHFCYQLSSRFIQSAGLDFQSAHIDPLPLPPAHHHHRHHHHHWYQPDRSGQISVARLAATLAAFELKVDLARLLEEMDKDADGQVTYDEFKALLGAGSSGAGAAGQ